METLFSDIASLTAQQCNRIFAFHNAVVDVVWKFPITISEYAEKVRNGEQFRDYAREERLGGSAINFAMVASAFRKKMTTVFAGLSDKPAYEMMRAMNKPEHLVILACTTKPRRNHVLEFTDANAVHHQKVEFAEAYMAHDQKTERFRKMDELLRHLRDRIRSSISASDWFASCSFSPFMTLRLLGHSNRFFFDSGYGMARQEKRILTLLCSIVERKQLPYSDFIISANGRELDSMADQFGIHATGLPDRAKAMADALSGLSGTSIRILLHTPDYSTVAEPGQTDMWLVPSFEISVKRRTNAGDTFSGAFLAAYDALGDPRPAVFFANAVAAKRIRDNEMPNPENVAQFLKTARMRSISMPPARAISLDQLKAITSSRKA